MGIAIAFAERERDLAWMTILRHADGSLTARRRRPDDRISPTWQTGAFNGLWDHVQSGGRYLPHDEILDEETGERCYDYSSWTDGRLWLRPIAEWHAIVDGRTRFEAVA